MEGGFPLGALVFWGSRAGAKKKKICVKRSRKKTANHSSFKHAPPPYGPQRVLFGECFFFFPRRKRGEAKEEERRLHSKFRRFTLDCKSRYLSQLAAFFIELGA